MMIDMQVTYVEARGTRAWLRIYWDALKGSKCSGPGGFGVHSAMQPLGEDVEVIHDKSKGEPGDYPDERWPAKCDDCGEPVPSGDGVLAIASSKCGCPECAQGQLLVRRQVFTRTLYRAPSGGPLVTMEDTPGVMFLADWYGCAERGGNCIHGWTNCDGKHLIVVLPNKHQWDVDGRASNCGSPNETTHRCWVRHGDPRTSKVHVDKSGNTCNAGAGSIQSGDWHGFLHNGDLHV